MFYIVEFLLIMQDSKCHFIIQMFLFIYSAIYCGYLNAPFSCWLSSFKNTGVFILETIKSILISYVLKGFLLKFLSQLSSCWSVEFILWLNGGVSMWAPLHVYFWAT